MTDPEPFGTTPLPTSIGGSKAQVWFDPTDALEVAQGPQGQQIALFETTPNDDCINGAIIDVNQHFVVYAVKNGLIRVLHRHSALRTLLRDHRDQRVTDIRFFQNGDVLGTVGSGDSSSSVFIWRIYERAAEITGEKLLELSTNRFQFSRLVWHPFSPNEFWALHQHHDDDDDIASLVQTTRITTERHATESHAVLEWFTDTLIMDGVVQIDQPQASVTDLCWSERDAGHVLSVHDDGSIRLWDVRKFAETAKESVSSPECLAMIQEDDSLSRCIFLPHEHYSRGGKHSSTTLTYCFATATAQNSQVTIWSPFGENETPTKLQIIGMDKPSSSYIFDVCHLPATAVGAPPPSCFLLLADRTDGKIFAFHIKSQWSDGGDAVKPLLVGCDYVVPFVTKYPVYSWSVSCIPAVDISEEELSEQGGPIFDMKLYAYQSSVVQCLTLTSYMCLPPEMSWTDPTPGVRVERLESTHQADISDGGYEEDYELDDEDEYEQAPEASALPAPDGLAEETAKPDASNPFANWLGSIATTTTAAKAESEPDEAPVVTPPEVRSNSHPRTTAPQNDSPALLTPYDLLVAGKMAETTTSSAKKAKPARGKSPKQTKANNNNKKPSNAPFADAKFSILKRPDAPQSETAPTRSAPPAVEAKDRTTTPNNLGNDKQVLESLFEQQKSFLANEIRSAVRSELEQALVPALQKVVREALDESVMQPIRSSIDQLGTDGVQVNSETIADAVSESVEEPLRAAFADGMKMAFIPAFESLTGQIFSKIADNLESPTSNNAAALEDVSTKLATMNAAFEQLSLQVQGLRSAVAQQQKVAVDPLSSLVPPPQHDPVKEAEDEILLLLKQRQYENAFAKALSVPTAEMAVFCCNNADVSDVLGGNAPVLSQPILLCLMQRLGVLMVSAQEANLQTELKWLQEIALSLDVRHESIHRHVPQVLQQLVESINAKMGEGNPQMRRPLQMLLQVIRGLQMG